MAKSCLSCINHVTHYQAGDGTLSRCLLGHGLTHAILAELWLQPEEARQVIPLDTCEYTFYSDEVNYAIQNWLDNQTKTTIYPRVAGRLRTWVKDNKIKPRPRFTPLAKYSTRTVTQMVAAKMAVIDWDNELDEEIPCPNYNLNPLFEKDFRCVRTEAGWIPGIPACQQCIHKSCAKFKETFIHPDDVFWAHTTEGA